MDGAICSDGDQPCVIGRPEEADHLAFMSGEYRPALLRLHVPDGDLRIFFSGAGYQQSAIRAPTQVAYFIPVAYEVPDPATGAHIPEIDLAVHPRAGDDPAVRRPGQCCKASLAMSLPGSEFVPLWVP